MSERSVKVLNHIDSLVNDILTYLDRDEDINPQEVIDKLQGIKNVIKLELS